MSLAPVTDHVERGVSRLIEQYKGKPRLEAWVSSYLEEVQELSDAAWEVIISRLIDDAEGAQLDVLGKIVGEKRNDREDELYRLFIRARVRVNRSRGLTSDLLDVLAIVSGTTPVLYNEYYPASILIEFVEEPEHDPELLNELLQKTKAGGVQLMLVSPTTTPEAQFLWGDVGDEVSPSDNGFGDSEDPDAFGLLSDAVA